MLRPTLSFLTFAAGCAACHALHARLNLPTIPVAAALGVLVSYLPAPRDAQTIFWTGVFVGMSSKQILVDWSHVAAASAVGAVYFTLARPYLDGVGGKMGAVAFLTTVTWLGVLAWIW